MQTYSRSKASSPLIFKPTPAYSRLEKKQAPVMFHTLVAHYEVNNIRQLGQTDRPALIPIVTPYIPVGNLYKIRVN